MKILKKLIFVGSLLFGISLISIFFCNYIIEKDTNGFTKYEIENLPVRNSGLLLGTSENLANGRKNPYFTNRIVAAAKLYHAGKVRVIIVSGDNSRKEYNEPEQMKLALVEKGVPEDRIFEDFAGFRTLDSVVRAKDIFGEDNYIIISQKFHNERAIYLAQKNGIQAFGYNAKDVGKNAGLKTNIREYFARVKVFVDLFFGVEPKFGGEKIALP